MKLTKAQLTRRKKKREYYKPIRYAWRVYLDLIRKEYTNARSA